MLISGKVAIVTGATGALGRVVVKKLLLEGGKVVALYRNKEKFKALQEYVDDVEGLYGYEGDATSEESCMKLIDETIRLYGYLDILVNIVGGYRGGFTLAETRINDWDWLMNLNLKSVYLCMKAVLPHMIERNYGKIVNISAKTSMREGRKAKSAAYAASKAGVRVLTEAVAEEVIRYEINVNCVMPSVIDTEANRSAFPKAKHEKWVLPEEIAEAILYLVSNKAKSVRGACLPVYGKS